MRIKFYWKPKCFQIGIAFILFSLYKHISIGYGPGTIDIQFYKDEEDYDPFMEV